MTVYRNTSTQYGAGRSALEPLLAFNEVCELFGVSRQTLYRIIDCGGLIPIRVGVRLRFDPADIRRYLDQRQVVP